jgi:hypothetical protein
MLEDGVKEAQRDEDVKVQDIAEVLLEGLQRAETAPAASAAEFQPGV